MYSHYYPRNAVDLRTDSEYRSLNEKHSWICYDFVIPTSYSVIEVSNDKSSWTEVDRREVPEQQILRDCQLHNFPYKNFTFFHFRQNQPNHCSNYAVKLFLRNKLTLPLPEFFQNIVYSPTLSTLFCKPSKMPSSSGVSAGEGYSHTISVADLSSAPTVVVTSHTSLSLTVPRYQEYSFSR